ncbi:MAG: CotH kinase family protein [Actinomycetota bacterium]
MRSTPPRLAGVALAVAVLAATCADDADDSAAPPTTEAAPTGEAAATSGEGDTEADAPAGEGDAEADAPAGDGVESDARWADGDSSVLFDQAQLHTYELTLSDEDLAFLDAEPTAEEYVPGTLTFDGETVENVGIRYKGSIGAFFSCVSGGGFPNLGELDGEKTCRKLSMKVKINFEGQDRRFYDVRRLQFHAMGNDASLMHERLGYLMYRSMGIAAPRAVHARLVINGEFVGVFALVEQIDGRFTRENWDEGGGNLYKEVWPIIDGRAANDAELFSGLKTNEDEDPSFDQVQRFGDAMASADEDDRGDTLRRFMSVDEVAAYVAVDRTIGNDDGAFHIYCFTPGEPCSPHNFYWYEDPARGTMHLIPWDLDHAFGNLISPANPVTPLSDPFGEISNDCRPQGGVFPQISSACDPILDAFASFEAETAAQTEAFLAGPFAAEATDALLDAWTEQIRTSLEEEADLHGDVSVNRWEQSVDYLRRQLDWARDQAG